MFFRRLKRWLRRNKVLVMVFSAILLILILYLSFSEENIMADKIVI